MDYWYIFDTQRANTGSVFASEVNVPLADAEEFGSLYIDYSNDLVAAGSRCYSMFASMRFARESRHQMAQTNGGARALMEVFTGHRTTRYNKLPLMQWQKE